MKAFIKTRYGGPKILQLEEVEKPSLGDDMEILASLVQSRKIKVHIEKVYPFKENDIDQ